MISSRITVVLVADRAPTRRERELLERVADRAVHLQWDAWRKEDKERAAATRRAEAAATVEP